MKIENYTGKIHLCGLIVTASIALECGLDLNFVKEPYFCGVT